MSKTNAMKPIAGGWRFTTPCKQVEEPRGAHAAVALGQSSIHFGGEAA